MERVDLSTTNILDENVEKLAEIFPEVVTEVREPDGSLRHTIDVEALKERVGDVAEGQRERYQFTWPGKRDAKQEAYRPIDKCLRPCPEESVNWDTTENLYIEGDNLDALKLLRNTYAGKIKMIYIDPPYNTGHDFIYDDDFARTKAEYDAESGDYDEEGGRLVANPESNGRFHSDWCSMMYPRLLLARDLLSEDGTIFISIDDAEVSNASRLLDEIFGGGNQLAHFIWKKKQGGGNDSGKVVIEHEYVIAYSKNYIECQLGLDLVHELDRSLYPFSDEKGEYGLITLDKASIQFSQSLVFEIVGPDGARYYPRVVKGKQSCWRWGKEKVRRQYDDLVFKNGKVYTKYYRPNGVKPRSLLIEPGYGRTESGNDDIKALFDQSPFSYPKPILLIKHAISLGAYEDSLILDFFSGSATTAHAVMKLNAEDGGNRKFIMVQLPEACDEKSEAAKAGYGDICEIGKERIRRAGKKIAAEVEESNRQLKLGEEPKMIPDIGFRVLKVDSSNFRDVSAEPAQFTQETLMGLADNLKPDRTADDLLFQVLPQLQIPLSAPIEKLDIQGFTVYSVDGGRLVACFDAGVTTDAIAAMAKLEPDYAVMRDASFVGDDVVSNFGELFKTYSPATITKVI